jgi:hypothetical protein
MRFIKRFTPRRVLQVDPARLSVVDGYSGVSAALDGEARKKFAGDI